MTEERTETNYLKLSLLDKQDENNSYLRPSLGIKKNTFYNLKINI